MLRKTFNSRFLILSLIILMTFVSFGCSSDTKEIEKKEKQSNMIEETIANKETISINAISNDQKALILERKHTLESNRIKEKETRYQEIKSKKEKQEQKEIELEKAKTTTTEENQKIIETTKIENNKNETSVENNQVNTQTGPIASPIISESISADTTDVQPIQKSDSILRYERLLSIQNSKNPADYTNDVYRSYTADEMSDFLANNLYSMELVGRNITISGIVESYEPEMNFESQEMLNGRIKLTTNANVYPIYIIVPANSNYEVGQPVSLTGVVYPMASDCIVVTCNVYP